MDKQCELCGQETDLLEFDGSDVWGQGGCLTVCDGCAVVLAAEIAERLTPEQLYDLAGVIARELDIRAAVAS
jgi:hypothetical protein